MYIDHCRDQHKEKLQGDLYFYSGKLWIIIVVVDGMETVQWHSRVHKRPTRMVEKESLDMVEAGKHDIGRS